MKTKFYPPFWAKVLGRTLLLNRTTGELHCHPTARCCAFAERYNFRWVSIRTAANLLALGKADPCARCWDAELFAGYDFSAIAKSRK